MDAGKGLRKEADADAHGDPCQGQPQQSAGDAEHQDLDQGLAQNRRFAGAQREAYGYLPAAAYDTHQQEPGKIGAGNKEHHDDCKEEHSNKRPSLGYRGLIERLDKRMNATAAERLGKAAHDLLRRGSSILLGLHGGHTGLQPPDQVVAPVSCTLYQFGLGEAHGHPKLTAVQLAGHKGKLEFARHHADDLVRLAVEENLLAQDMNVAMETAAPRLVAENCQLLAALILLLSKGAAHQRRNAEHRKDTCGESCGVDLSRGALAGEFIGRGLVTAQAGEGMGVAHVDASPGRRDTGCISAILYAFQDIAERD